MLEVRLSIGVVLPLIGSLTSKIILQRDINISTTSTRSKTETIENFGKVYFVLIQHVFCGFAIRFYILTILRRIANPQKPAPDRVFRSFQETTISFAHIGVTP